MPLEIALQPDGTYHVSITADSTPHNPDAPGPGLVLVNKDLWGLANMILNLLEDLEGKGQPTWPCNCGPSIPCTWCEIGIRVRAAKNIRGPRI